jgi:hypothetical protein
MGPAAVGLLRRHLPHPDAALWDGDGEREPVVVEYVLSLFCEDMMLNVCVLADFVQAKETPSMITTLGYKIFFMFATINIGAMATFSL